jgi:predicted metal-dependent hydrolase
MLWDAACSIRGAKDAPKYKDHILPLVFVKRLCDVYDDEINRNAQEVGAGPASAQARAKAFKHLTDENKWASYTRRTNLLIFNTELLDLDEDLGDYVIVHELLHFRVPNHGKLWKSLMRAHLGDYERQEKRLNQIVPKIMDEW